MVCTSRPLSNHKLSVNQKVWKILVDEEAECGRFLFIDMIPFSENEFMQNKVFKIINYSCVICLITSTLHYVYKERQCISKYIQTMNERWVMAIRIQCFARSVLSKIKLRKLRHDEWQRRHPLAAVQIQRLFRGKLGRGYAKVRQMEVERRKQLEKRSCILIQSTVRRLAARKIVNLTIFDK